MAEEMESQRNESFEKESNSSLSHDQQSSNQETTSRPDVRTDQFSARIKQYRKDELKLFEGKNLIGAGGFGNVRKYYHKEKIVAIKEFAISGDDETILRIWNMVQREANILCRFQHENIVKILGVIQWPNVIGIIMEFIDGGNLRSLLSEDRQSKLQWKTRLDIASGITSGLEYIHNYDETKIFCHGDLKPANILLTQSLQVKLADFGSAAFHRATGASTTTIKNVSTTQFTLIYVAPEFLEDNTRKRNPAMDMYSFGLVLYELLSRRAPYSDSNMPMHIPALIMAKVKPSMKLIDDAESQLESGHDREAFKLLKNVMMRSWNNDPSLRPSSKTVKAELNTSVVNRQGAGSPNHGIETISIEPAASKGRNVTGTSFLLGNNATVQDFLAKYTDSLLNVNFEQADMFRAALRVQVIEEVIAEAEDVRLFAQKLLEEESYLQAVAAFDTAAALFANLNNPNEDLERIQFCVQGMKVVNEKMIEEESNMKVIVRGHVIPLMHNWVREMKGASQVSEKWRCHAMSWARYHIDLCETSVDQWEEGKQTIEEAVSDMRRVFGDDVHKQHGRLFGNLLHNLGVNYKHETRVQEAAALFEESLRAHQAGLDYFGLEEERKRNIEICNKALKIISRSVWEEELKMQ